MFTRTCHSMHVLLLLWALPALVFAGPTLQLDSMARAEVSNDEMIVVLAMERKGMEIGSLNAQVLSRLNEAIADAKKTPKVRARLGGVSTQPDWSSGKQSGWQVRGEVVLESADMEALSKLSANLAKTLQLSSVQFRLSSARKAEEEGKLLHEAVGRFREKAASAAKAFGFADYTLRDMSLLHQDGMPPPHPMMSARIASAESAQVPTEGGRSEISVRVSGTVELK